MAKTRRERTKACSRCNQVTAVLFRVRIELDGNWFFVCQSCLDQVKSDNPHYQYGGTWKSQKRHWIGIVRPTRGGIGSSNHGLLVSMIRVRNAASLDLLRSQIHAKPEQGIGNSHGHDE